MIKNRFYSMSLIVCMLVAIPSSSFFLSDFLTEIIVKQSHSKRQLDYALGQNNQVALTFAWNNSKAESKQWLYLAKKLAKTDGNAAYKLAKYYQKQQLYTQTVAWYQRAVRHEYPQAFTSLAQFYFEQNKLDKADELLGQLGKLNNVAKDAQTQISEVTMAEAIILRIQLAIVRGDISFVEQALANSQQLIENNPSGQDLLKDIDKYQVISKKSLQQNRVQTIESSGHCDNSIQFFATNLRHLKQVERLILQFKKQTLAKFVCFSPVRYMAIDLLDCSMEKTRAISCNEQKWSKVAKTVESRFVALLLPEGGANVHLGALYIDAEDDIDVLTHEISHLLGFVDEYPLIKDHVKCQRAQQETFSENISILPSIYSGNKEEVRAHVLTQLSWANTIKKSTPILQAIKRTDSAKIELWRLGTPIEFTHEVGVFHAKTCAKTINRNGKDESVNIAVKPSFNATKMEYFSLGLPDSYYENLERNKGEFVMPSFHYNIALAHIKQGKIEEAQLWLEKSLKLEGNARRRAKILQGAF